MSTDKTITITVSGRAMTGKTTIAKLIRDYLLSIGVVVETPPVLESTMTDRGHDWNTSLDVLRDSGIPVALQVHQTHRTRDESPAPPPPTGAVALPVDLFDYGPGPDTLDDNSIPGVDE